MSEIDLDNSDLVSVFVIPNERADSTLTAISAMRDAGADRFLTADAAAGGTLSGTDCVWEGHPPNSFRCGDSDG